MAKVAYFDASALVKRYSEERGTQLVNEVFRLLPNSARSCSVITLAEVTAVLVRKRNDGRIPRSLYKGALKNNFPFSGSDLRQIRSIVGSKTAGLARLIRGFCE